MNSDSIKNIKFMSDLFGKQVKIDLAGMLLSDRIKRAIMFEDTHEPLANRDPQDLEHPFQQFELISRRELESWIKEAEKMESK